MVEPIVEADGRTFLRLEPVLTVRRNNRYSNKHATMVVLRRLGLDDDDVVSSRKHS
jgi:hypothetical protein